MGPETVQAVLSRRPRMKKYEEFLESLPKRMRSSVLMSKRFQPALIDCIAFWSAF